MFTQHRPLWLAALLGLSVVAAACGGGGGSAGSGGAGKTVGVTLRDFRIEVAPASVPAGTITFDASNEGPSTHELEVLSVPSGVDPTKLPVSANVADTSGLKAIDEVENVASSTSTQLTVDLAPGTYALICNVPGHYAQGMSTTFTVT